MRFKRRTSLRVFNTSPLGSASPRLLRFPVTAIRSRYPRTANIAPLPEQSFLRCGDVHRSAPATTGSYRSLTYRVAYQSDRAQAYQSDRGLRTKVIVDKSCSPAAFFVDERAGLPASDSDCHTAPARGRVHVVGSARTGRHEAQDGGGVPANRPRRSVSAAAEHDHQRPADRDGGLAAAVRCTQLI
jgi:hypothetical protein